MVAVIRAGPMSLEFSRVYFPSRTSTTVTKNRARYNTNPNNRYFEEFKNIIEERQGSGYYSASYYQDESWISDAEKTKMEVAAQAICNHHQFEGVEYETDTFTDGEGDEWFNINFDWSGGISHESSSDDGNDDDDDDSGGDTPNCPVCGDAFHVEGPDGDGEYSCTYSNCDPSKYFT